MEKETNNKNAVKFDNEKPMMELIEPCFLFGLADVLTHGAKKYNANNWKKGDGLDSLRLYGAIQRHLNQWRQGEDIDKDSSLPHLYHVACELMFLCYNQEYRKDIDTRRTILPSAFIKSPSVDIIPPAPPLPPKALHEGEYISYDEYLRRYCPPPSSPTEPPPYLKFAYCSDSDYDDNQQNETKDDDDEDDGEIPSLISASPPPLQPKET